MYAEPVGSKAPSFSTESALSSIKRHQGQSFALLCQAQAFPVPIFRQVSKFILLISTNNLIEPVGAKSPTFSTESMGSIFRKREGQPFTLLCQAQSYPAPVFRQVFFFFLTSQNLWPPKHQLFLRTLVVQLLYATSDKVSDYCVKHRPFPYRYSGKFLD